MDNEQKSEGNQSADTQTQTILEPNSIAQLPATNQESSRIADSPVTPKHRGKLLYLSALLVLIIAGGIYYYLSNKNNSSNNTAGSKQSLVNISSAKRQYFLNDSVAGFINYKPIAFKEVSATKLPTIPQANPSINTIIVQANVVGFSDSGLYLYDLKANKTYKLTDGGGSPRIMSDHYLLYAFDTGNGKNKRLGGKLLDLQTGKTQTVFSDNPENVPGTVCCSVSPDGFKAAFVQKDKISIWDIRTQSSTNYTATVNPIDPNFSRTTANGYNTENSYATPAWLDNENIIYSNKPADSPVSNQPAQIVDDTLYKLALSDGKSIEITTSESGIYSIYVEAGSTFVDEIPVGQTSSQISLVLLDGMAPRTIGLNPGFALVSPSALNVYMFSTLDSGGYYSVIKTDANDPNVASVAFNPHIPGVTISQILPRGWIDNNRMLLAELDTAGTQNHEYIAIYNTTTDKVEQYLKIN